MAEIPVAASFLAFSILTLVLPVGLLIAIAVWHIAVVRRVHDRGLPPTQPPGTPPPVSEVTAPDV